MPLDVWIGEPTSFVGRPAVSFEPEAYYVFLVPLFEEFARIHGPMIDQFDGAAFLPTKLDSLLTLVADAEKQIAAQPSEFTVHMGTSRGSYLEPRNEEIHYTVKRDDYLSFMNKLRAAVLQAQTTNQTLIFFGD